MASGASGVEVDVQMTKDSVLVLFHDMTLNASTELEGCIREKTWQELHETLYQTGPVFDAFHNDKIISLDTVLSWLGTFPEFPHLHLDIRSYVQCDTIDHQAGYKELGKYCSNNWPSMKYRKTGCF